MGEHLIEAEGFDPPSREALSNGQRPQHVSLTILNREVSECDSMKSRRVKQQHRGVLMERFADNVAVSAIMDHPSNRPESD